MKLKTRLSPVFASNFCPNFDHRKIAYSGKFQDNCRGFKWTHIIGLHFYNGIFAWFTLCKRAHKHK